MFGLWRRVRKDGRIDQSSDVLPYAIRLHNFWIDQGFLRRWYHNQAEIVPGVYRSNQPDLRRLTDLREKGVKTVLLLRGTQVGAPYEAEEHNCARLGMRLISFPMSARRLPAPERIQELILLLRDLDKPFLMHCRAGADRTGIASAIYLLAVENAPVENAQGMLSFRFGHWDWTDSGILDLFLFRFAQAQKETGVGFVDWVANVYDPVAITQEFKKGRGLFKRLLARR